MDNLGASIDANAIKAEKNSLLLEHVLKQVASTTTKEKLKALRAVLLNSWRGASPEETTRDFFVGKLSSLQELHVAVIGVIHRPTADCIETALWIKQQNSELVELAYRELVSMSLARQLSIPFLASAEYDTFNGALTDLGVLFASFIHSPSTKDA